MTKIKIPGFVKIGGYVLAAVAITSIVTMGFVYVLWPSSEIQQLTQQYAQVKTVFAFPGIDTLLALSTILVGTSLLGNTMTAGIWWLVAGIVTGAVLRNRRGCIVGNLFTPMIIALIAGYPIMATFGYAENPLWPLATKNALNGLIAGLVASLAGVQLGNQILRPRRIAQQRVIIQKLYHTEIEQLKVTCPKCGTVLNSKPTYCGVCGSPLSSTATPSNAAPSNK